MMNIGPISNPSILIKPSNKLLKYIGTIEVSADPPVGITNVIFENESSGIAKPSDPPQYVTTDDDRQFLKILKLDSNVDITKFPLNDEAIISERDKLLNLQDVHWLYGYLCKQNAKVYIHELLEGSDIVVPKNNKVPRNAELEKRCECLRVAQQNRMYSSMTKNVDNTRRKHPEDTISFQMKQMNRHLIAIAQFIISVLAGFVFGFVGVELLVGGLDFGFRLLLGIIGGLTVALAELHFLAQKLNNDDLKYEITYEVQKEATKLD